jgi:hypothetical protein
MDVRYIRIQYVLSYLILSSTSVACRSMNMKVHQTLVKLNLLSFRTKDLTEPTIGIQSGLCHRWGLARTASQQRSPTTLLRNFVSINPASSLSSCILSSQSQLCVPYVQPPPHTPILSWPWVCRASTGFCWTVTAYTAVLSSAEMAQGFAGPARLLPDALRVATCYR